MMRFRAEEPNLHTSSNQRVARRIVWSDGVVRALAELRARYPHASFEVSALELALSDVTRHVEIELELASGDAARTAVQSAGTISDG